MEPNSEDDDLTRKFKEKTNIHSYDLGRTNFYSFDLYEEPEPKELLCPTVSTGPFSVTSIINPLQNFSNEFYIPTSNETKKTSVFNADLLVKASKFRQSQLDSRKSGRFPISQLSSRRNSSLFHSRSSTFSSRLSSGNSSEGNMQLKSSATTPESKIKNFRSKKYFVAAEDSVKR